MSAETIKATVKASTQGKTVVTIAIYALLTLFSVSMAIFDFVSSQILFGILFVMAAAIFIILLLIKGNAAFGTSIKIEGDELLLKSWANDFLPYDVNGGILSDLVPAKTKLTIVPISEITCIYIGTKEYIKRNITTAGKRFIKALFPYEHSSNKQKKNMLSAIDIFYVETTEDDCSFMCIHDYDPEDVTKILAELNNINPDITIKVNNREYKRYIAKIQKAED